jgi:hypothetical protein
VGGFICDLEAALRAHAWLHPRLRGRCLSLGGGERMHALACLRARHHFPCGRRASYGVSELEGRMTYLGEGGETTALVIHLQDQLSRPGVGRAVAVGAQTHGDFGLFRGELAAGTEIAAHFHRTFSESFYLLSGEIELWNGACGPARPREGWSGRSDALHPWHPTGAVLPRAPRYPAIGPYPNIR